MLWLWIPQVTEEHILRDTHILAYRSKINKLECQGKWIITISSYNIPPTIIYVEIISEIFERNNFWQTIPNSSSIICQKEYFM